MKNFNQLSKRVVAFALALIMVLGYVPVGTVAAMETPSATAKTDTLVQVSLKAVGNEAPPIVSIPEDDMPPATIESYTYNAKVEALIDGEMTDVTQNAEIKTVTDDVSKDGCTDYTVDVEQEFTVEITYRGAHFTLKSKDTRDAEDGIVKAFLNVTYQTSHTLTQGQKFNENQFVPTVSNTDESGKWSFEPAKDFADQYVKDGAVIAPVGEGLIFGSYIYRIGENEPLAQINLVINVQAPTYDIKISGADEGRWYALSNKSMIVVTVTAKANVAIEGKNNMPGNLPVVTAEGAIINDWRKSEDNTTFTREIDITKTTTVTVGNQSLTVHVDGIKPTISNVWAYESKEGTVVELVYDVGDSGVAKVELVASGNTYTFDKFSENPTRVLLKGVYVYPDKISKVTITSGAGLTSDPYPTVNAKINVTPYLFVSLTPPTAIAEIEGVKYINEGAKATFEISNVSNNKNDPTYLDPQNIKVSFTDKDGKEGQKSIEGLTFSNGKYTGSFAVNAGDKNFYVSATDASVRSAKAEDLSTYACDVAGPVITLTPNENGEEYKNHALTYKVTITDQVYLNLEKGTNASISVQYTINGETKDATNIIKDTNTANTYYVEIPVVDGQTLGTITVNATDNCGNPSNEDFTPNVTVDMQRPVVTVEPSDNITAFYQKTENGEDVIYAQLSDTTDKAEVIFTVTVKDANLPDQPLEGWDLTEDGSWVKEFKKVVNKNQTGVKMSLEIPEIKDKAGWVISNESDCTKAPYISIEVENESNLSNDNVLTNSIEMKYTEGTEQTEGGFKLDLLFDRRSPSSEEKVETPELTLIMPAGVNDTHPHLYNGETDLKFMLKVTDLYEPSEQEKYSGSGVAKVEWSVDDGLLGNYLEKVGKDFDDVANGEELTLPVVIKNNQVNETNSARIIITVTDYLGNKFSFTSKTFSVDNKAPEIKVEKTINNKENYIQTVDEVDYFDSEVTYTVTVTDANVVTQKDGVDEDSGIVLTFDYEGDEVKLEKSCTHGELKGKDTVVYTFTLKDGNALTGMTITAVDYAGNSGGDNNLTIEETAGKTAFNFDEAEKKWTYSGNTVIVDMTAPEIKVEKTINNKENYIQTVNGVDYFDSEVTYTVTVTDANVATQKDGVDEDSGVVLTLDYKGDTVTLNESYEHGELVADDTVVYTFTLKDGNALTGMTITAVDYAGNSGGDNNLTIEETAGKTAFNFDEAEKKWTYSGNTVIVDMTAPEIKVEKTINNKKNYIQTVDGVDYFDSEVTYTVTVTDANVVTQKDGVDEDSGVVLTLDYKGDTVTLDKSYEHGELVAEDTVVYTFTLKDGNALTDMTITAVDFAGNAYVEKEKDSNNLTVADPNNQEEEIHTSFEYNEKESKWDYTGRPVVVDTTAPTATMSFSENVVGVYTNGDTIYVKLEESANAGSGFFAKQDKQTVEMSITVVDKNISVFKKDANEIGIKTMEGDGKWDGKPEAVNTDTTITYKQSIAVAADKTGAFSFQLNIHDLAGNAADFTFTPINKEVAELKVENGVITNTISVDRRRPSSVDDDNSAPVIEIKPTITPTTSSNELELFAGAFDFKLTVTDGKLTETDGKPSKLNSGLAVVSWEIKDETGFVIDSSVKNVLKERIEVNQFEIPVKVDGHGESNQVNLTITAVDNVGNTTTYTKDFAVDNLAPRISVTYDNNSVLNGKYFKADRTATISVTDINFNPKTTPISTQVGFSQWTQNGSTWTCVGSYTTDGQYTFKVESTDLAGNTTADAAVDYSNQAAPREFVIDKTAPVINVTFNPASPVGRDDKNVSFYDQSVNVVVNIREVNFNAADVNAQFNSNNSLGAFAGGSDLHSAYETFDEGNEYRFSVAYTDLAGNAAVPYQSETFSVDLHEPTIKITEGSMTTEQLNMVQDELVLGFTINDEQENLKNYSVSVTHLNNEFKAVPVTGADIYTVSSADERTTVRVSFANIAQEKERDGIYTVEITAEDYAGHKVTLEPVPQLLFSLNRFGSTFMTDDAFTQSFLMPGEDSNVYQNTVDKKLIFKEINPNQVWQNSDHTTKGSLLTVVVNGTTTALAEGADYAVTESQEGVGNAKWFVYTYEVEPSAFMKDEQLVDGRYSLLIYSEDEAGNKNTNESNEFGAIQADATGAYSGKIEFTLDTSAPIISTTGIETGGSYNTTNQKLKIFLSDNTPVEILVNLNGQAVALAESAGADNAAWLIWDDAESCYILNVPEQKVLFGHQNVKIQATDAAGNGAEAEISEFTVSSNLFVRIANSIWLWIIGAVLVIAILVLVVLLNKKRRKR